LVRPPRPVSTAAAYAAFDRDPAEASSPDAVIAALEKRDAAGLGRAVVNNLTAAAISIVPEVADALAWVRCSEGVTGAAVCGSGSAVFALCDSSGAAQTIADEALGKGWWALATALGDSGVVVHEQRG
jgi:4-diphosphocytidyl-2-C-methyl-D-erythritol kinase